MKNFRAFAATALLAGTAALSPSGAHAEGYAKKDHKDSVAISSQTFSKLDTDRSGTLSESEYSQDTAASIDFSKADANNDGMLTLAEAQSVNVAAKTNPAPMAD